MIDERIIDAAWQKLAEVMDCDPEARGIFELDLIDGLVAALEVAAPLIASKAIGHGE